MEKLPNDLSEVSLEDYDAGYMRVINAKKGINDLYYINKKSDLVMLIKITDEQLQAYDQRIKSKTKPFVLDAENLASISAIIPRHDYRPTYRIEQLNTTPNVLDTYDIHVARYHGAKVIDREPTREEIQQVCASHQILVIRNNGAVEIGFCDKEGKYKCKVIDDSDFLKSYFADELVTRHDDQECINRFLAAEESASFVTKTGDLCALSLKQRDYITFLTGHTYQDKQSLPLAYQRMASAILAGITDGLYTYLGMLGLLYVVKDSALVLVVGPMLFAILAGCCILFSILCVINRCYEEYGFQQDFHRSRLNVEFVLLQKEIEQVFF